MHFDRDAEVERIIQALGHTRSYEWARVLGQNGASELVRKRIIWSDSIKEHNFLRYKNENYREETSNKQVSKDSTWLLELISQANIKHGSVKELENVTFGELWQPLLEWGCEEAKKIAEIESNSVFLKRQAIIGISLYLVDQISSHAESLIYNNLISYVDIAKEIKNVQWSSISNANIDNNYYLKAMKCFQVDASIGSKGFLELSNRNISSCIVILSNFSQKYCLALP